MKKREKGQLEYHSMSWCVLCLPLRDWDGYWEVSNLNYLRIAEPRLMSSFNFVFRPSHLPTEQLYVWSFRAPAPQIFTAVRRDGVCSWQRWGVRGARTTRRVTFSGITSSSVSPPGQRLMEMGLILGRWPLGYAAARGVVGLDVGQPGPRELRFLFAGAPRPRVPPLGGESKAREEAGDPLS